MSYPYSYNNEPEVEVTKREMFVSALFFLLAFVGGLCIAGSIRSCEDDANVKYYQAVKIADSTQFNYAFKTNAGHTLAYGTVSAIGFVTDEGIGNYMTLTRVLEEYRKHHRTVCSGAGWMRWFKEVVEDDHRDYGMTTTVGEYLELFTSNSGECDHHLIEV